MEICNSMYASFRFPARIPLIIAFLVLLCPVERANAQPFTFYLAPHVLPMLNYGAVSAADANADGIADVLLMGNDRMFSPYQARSYMALGAPRSRETAPAATHTLIPLERTVWLGSFGWADYDRDGDIDFLMSGTTSLDWPFAPLLRLYENEGDGRFEDLAFPGAGVYAGDITWADFDNDGDDDVLVIGVSDNDVYRTALYLNQGAGFKETGSGLPDVAFGAASAADFDGDGLMDVALSGAERSGGLLTRLYRNEGAGVFTLTDNAFPGLVFSSIDWGDFDQDGDPDLVVSGAVPGLRVLEGMTFVYRNLAGRFVEAARFEGGLYGDVLWGDYDLDGALDLFVIGGETAYGRREALVYRYESDRFRPFARLAGAIGTSATLLDYGNDNDLDLLYSGLTLSGAPLTNLYENDQKRVNTPPDSPEGLSAAVSGRNVMLSWAAGRDEGSLSPGLTYNLRVGTRPGAVDVVAPMASVETGYRWVSARGNAGQIARRPLTNLPPGPYYWSVQAIDASYSGSGFAPESTFRITSQSGGGQPTDVPDPAPERYPSSISSYPNPFNQETIITYSLSGHTEVVLTVFDLLGHKVKTLVQRRDLPGTYSVPWNGLDASGREVASGLYFIRIRTDAGTRTKSVTLVR